MLLLLSITASAQSIKEPVPRPRPETPEELVSALGGSHAPDQLCAARELRRLTRMSLKETASRDPIRSLEARQFLAVFDNTLAPLCIELLTEPKLTRPCADILSLLETDAALPALKARLPETARGTQRSIERAIQTLEE